MPGMKRIVRGSAIASPSRLASRIAAASSSLMRRDEKTWPLPMRCCSGMRHCHPALRAMTRVSGIKGSTRAHGTAIARSHCSHSRPVLEPGLELLLDQQAAEARAIDEQVAGDAACRWRAGPRRRRRSRYCARPRRSCLPAARRRASRQSRAGTWRRGSRRNDRRRAAAAARCPAAAGHGRSDSPAIAIVCRM